MSRYVLFFCALFLSFNAMALVCIDGRCDNEPLDNDENIISTRQLEEAAIEESLRQRQKRDRYHERNDVSIPGLELHVDTKDFYRSR